MYLKRFDYVNYPRQEFLYEFAQYRNEAIRYISGHAEEILTHFMKVWLYSYRYGIDHWVHELAYNFITEAPIIKPKNRIMKSDDIVRYIELDKLMSDRNLNNTLKKLIRRYKKFDPRPDYSGDFPRVFKIKFHEYVKKFSEELVRATRTGVPITELDIEDIIGELNING